MTAAALPAFVGPVVRRRQTHPTPTYFEISFNKSPSNEEVESPPRLDALVFRNFYCSHITVKQRRQLDGTSGVGNEAGAWSTVLLDRPLMEDPHHEDDAQHWHVIAVEEFSKEYDADSASPLRCPLVIRIYLHQPSPMWKTFGLHHVKCIKWSGLGPRVPEEPRCVDSADASEADLAGLCRNISEQVKIFVDRTR